MPCPQGSIDGQALCAYRSSPPAPAAEMEERVQGYPGPYVSDSNDEDQEEKQPAKSAEQEDMEEDLEDGLAPKPNTLEYLFDESDNTEWIVDDVKDQYLLEQEQDKSDSSDTDEQDEED